MKKIAFILMALVWISCNKNDADAPVIVHTGSSTYVSESSCIVSGEITNTGGGKIIARGFLIGSSNELNFDNSECIRDPHPGYGAFAYQLNDLSADRKYYFRAWAENSQGVVLAEDVEPVRALPRLTNLSCTVDKNGNIVIKYIINDAGRTMLRETGVYYSTDESTIAESKVTENNVVKLVLDPKSYQPAGVNEGEYVGTYNDVSAIIEKNKLVSGVKYYYRCFAVNAMGETLTSDYNSFGI